MKKVGKKILPWYFEAVRNGSKTFEIRKDEDGFEVGDHILLCEWSGTAYTGFTLETEITYILRDAEQYGLMPGFCILGIKALDGKDTNVHTNSALDHIHNVVAEREYQRGYEQAKEEYDHKLTVIKSRIKDHYYNKGYKQGKAETNRPEIPDSWIPVSERLPEEKTNPNTYDFEEVLCSTTFGDVRTYKFGTPWGWEKPHFWHGGGIMDEYVEAWMPKPEPWEGNVDAEVQNDKN